MLAVLQKAPFPYYGGKRQAAPLVWSLLGDVCHYVEPFAGSCAVLLERPHPCNRSYYSETVNDADGLLVNALRSLALHPQATAQAASWYVSEADMHARHVALLRWVAQTPLELLMGDPSWCDPQMAGWWLWGICCWIGGGWCSGTGPWTVDRETGRFVQQTGTREPGVTRSRPHVAHNGRGVNHAGTREPGVTRPRPYVISNGQGVNRPGTREPGVWRKRPHVSHNGQGVNRPWTREPGVIGTVQPASDIEGWQALVEADYRSTQGFHPMTMPELRRWCAALAARLRHVRILNGDWQRAVTTGVLKTLQVRQNQGIHGVFLDPPYALEARDSGLYRVEATRGRDLAAEVRAWCLAHGADNEGRIVLAGFAGEGHEVLEAHGWQVHAWFREGHLRGGMGEQQHRERLWSSPHCLGRETPVPQLSLFGSSA